MLEFSRNYKVGIIISTHRGLNAKSLARSQITALTPKFRHRQLFRSRAASEAISGTDSVTLPRYGAWSMRSVLASASGCPVSLFSDHSPGKLGIL